MECDQVFKVLTSGPFPTGESWDEEVEAHLEACADCWRLAEALRPALEVFQEAVPPAESRNLPGYWGDARPASAAVAELTRRAVQTAVVNVRRVNSGYQNYPRQPLASEFSTDVLRSVVLAAMMAAAVFALMSLFR
jgi:hypothetical protein